VSGETDFKGPYCAQSVGDAVFVGFLFGTNQAGEDLDNDFSRPCDENAVPPREARQMAGQTAKWRRRNYSADKTLRRVPKVFGVGTKLFLVLSFAFVTTTSCKTSSRP
jgi:hypothetical protein